MHIADSGIGAEFGQVLLEPQKGARKFDRSARRRDDRCNTELACAWYYHDMIILLS